MKAIVTGSAGFVGRHLVEALRQARWRVTTLDRHPPADIVADLARDALPRLSADVVFHLAGQSNPARSSEQPGETYASNAMATARLARAVRAGRLVLASSCHVYGDVPPRENPIDESRLPIAATPYAASKLCAEALARTAWRDVIILRPFNHTGPGQSEAFVCPRIARQIARAETGLGPRVIEVAVLRSRFDLFDVRDMVRAYLLAAERGRAGEVYNVARGRAWSVGELVKFFRSQARVPMRVHAASGPPSLRVGNASKFRRATGWRPLIPLEETLSDILKYERARLGALKGLNPPLPFVNVSASS